MRWAKCRVSSDGETGITVKVVGSVHVVSSAVW